MVIVKFREIFDIYRNNLLREFHGLNEQERYMISYCGDLVKRVNEFLVKEDDRMEIVYQFQKDYNLFLSNWPDLIFKENAKAEYHKRY
jgi:hypothetical protein